MRFSYKGVLDPDNKVLTPEGWQTAEDVSLVAAAAIMAEAAWCHQTFKDGRKDSRHFIASHAVVFDIDEGDPTLEQAVNNLFCDYAHIIGTTRSHRRRKDGLPARDRYRVVIPTERPMTAPEHRANYKQAYMRHAYGDPSQKAMARGWAPFREVVSINLDGDLWEVSPAREAKERHRYPEGTQSPPIWLINELRSPWAEGHLNDFGGRNNQAFRWGCRMARAGVSLGESLDLFQFYKPVGDEPLGEFILAIKSAYQNERREALETKHPQSAKL